MAFAALTTARQLRLRGLLADRQGRAVFGFACGVGAFLIVFVAFLLLGTVVEGSWALAVVVAPLAEEHLKALSVALAARHGERPLHVASFAHLGAWVGVGFASAEMLLYGFSAPGGASLLVPFLLVRAFLTYPLHAATAALSGYAVVRSHGRPLSIYTRGLGPSILIHAGYNALLLLALS